MMRIQKVTSALLPIGVIFILLCQSALAYQWGRSSVKTDSGDTEFTPGVLATVKGRIQLTESNPLSRLNPTRASRQLSYDYPARTAYRSGNIEYPAQSKMARDQTRPITKPAPTGIRGTAQSAFSKNLPALYPYTAGSSLRPGSAAKLTRGEKPKPVSKLSFEPESTRGEQG